MTRILKKYEQLPDIVKEIHHIKLAGNHFSYNAMPMTEGRSPSTENVLDLISDTKKILVVFYNNIYPFLCVVDQVLFFTDLEENSDIEIIADIGHSTIEYSNFSKWVSEILTVKNIKHRIIDSTKHDAMNINNFVFAGINSVKNDVLFDGLYERSLPFVKNPEVKPFRKVFISRKEHENRRNSAIDTRCDDQKALEDIFTAKGFEICYPERDFNSFSDQVSYFYEAEVVAGLSGGGLTNTIFMQPEGKVIELLTTFKFNYGLDETITEELHDYYQHIAYIKKHMLISISNIDRSSQSLDDLMKKFDVLDKLV